MKNLFFDIDGTLINYKFTNKSALKIRNKYASDSLFYVLEKAGKEIAGLWKYRISDIINGVRCSVSWWSWNDFIKALNIPEEKFWEYALKIEKEYLEASSYDIPRLLRNISGKGYKLYIATNNPIDGALHKLRIAGFNRSEIESLFSYIFTAHELHHYKWEKRFWELIPRFTVQHKIIPSDSVVIGDNFCDDYQIPISVGCAGSFIISQQPTIAQHAENITFVSRIENIERLL